MFVFANGCFWGSEKGIWRLPGDVYSTAVGYAAGVSEGLFEMCGKDTPQIPATRRWSLGEQAMRRPCR